MILAMWCDNTLATALWYHNILATVFALVAVLLMGVILLQRGRGVGLSGAFGGAGGHTAFGAKTGDVLTWATIIIAVVLLTLTIILNFVFVARPAIQTAPPPPVPTLPAEGITGDTTPATDQPAATTEAPAPEATPQPAASPPPAPETNPPADTPPAQEKPSGGETPIQP